MNLLLQNPMYSGVGEHLFLSEELSDIVISVENGGQSQWRFPAHSLILTSQSDVFQRMLDSDFSEKATGSIIIKDIQPKTVELLLGYIYRGRVNLENWLDCLELLRAAHKYDVTPLVQYCIRFLESVVSISNVCYIYDEACLYLLSHLKEKCLKLILDAAFVVLPSKAFETLAKEAVMDVISSRDLNADGERMIFEALWRWVSMRCCRLGLQIDDENILKELTPFLKYICFDVMSDADKSSLPPAVLSCVRPSSHNRISPCVPSSLLQYAHAFRFCTHQDVQECIYLRLCCIRFSLNTAQYLIGLNFVISSTDIQSPLHMSVIRETSGKSSAVIYSSDFTCSSFDDTFQVNEQVFYEAVVFLRQPCRVDSKTVYRLELTDRSRNAHCLRTALLQHTLLTERGNVTISLHSDKTWCVKKLIFM